MKISESKFNKFNIIEFVLHSLIYNEAIEIKEAIKEGILSINGKKITEEISLQSINPLVK